jgi:PAS domain S-box-containing protein
MTRPLPHQATLATRLIAAFVIMILVTSIAAGVPAYVLIRSELEQQTWSRVEDAHRATGILLEGERARLSDLVTLTAQRPTLQRLLRGGRTADFEEYLQTLQQSVDLDLLAVYDVEGNFLARTAFSEITRPTPGASGTSHFVMLRDQVAMLAEQEIRDPETGEVLGYVTAGLLIDDDFMDDLAAETGFEQRMILGDRRIAASFPDLTMPSESIRQAARDSGLPQQSPITLNSTPYYAVLSPLPTDEGTPFVLLETLLPVSTLVEARQRAIAVLAISTAAVSGIALLAGSLLAQRLARPLEALTTAAQKISEGDLTTPIPITGGTRETTTLAAALEESRAHTRDTIDELSLARAWSDNLLSSINEGVVTFDTRSMITFFNEGAERITGWSAPHVIGKLLNDVFQLAEDNAESFLDRIPPRGGKQTIQIRGADSRPMTLAVSGARLIPPHSDELQVVLVFRDVTEEEAARNLRSYFLANITHEFRTPLSALNASIELLLDEAEHLDQPALSELAGSLYLSVVNLQTLIDNLLESSSIEAGRFTVRRRSTDLNSVAAEAIRVMQPLLDRRQQTLSVSEPFTLAPIEADPTRLLQVLINLIANASKYSPPASSIDLSLEMADNFLRVSIADRGPGISPADRDSLFRQFMRLDGTSTEYGIGLGLSVAKAIVDGHGGQIGVSERKGGGSIFWFTLPTTDQRPIRAGEKDLDV